LLETSTVREEDKKFVGTFEMWCWRRMEEISWTDRVRNEEVLHRVKEERNIVQTVKIRKANWIGHILCRNCVLKHVIEGAVAGRKEKGRRGRRGKQLLNDLNPLTPTDPFSGHTAPLTSKRCILYI